MSIRTARVRPTCPRCGELLLYNGHGFSCIACAFIGPLFTAAAFARPQKTEAPTPQPLRRE